MSKNIFTIVMFFLISLKINSCSEDTNINKLFLYTGGQNESISVLIAKAQYEYDRGNFSKALSYAKKAYHRNPQNEDIAILLGYIHLSLAHMDSLQIAKVLVETSKENSTKLAETSNKTLDLFSSLAKVLQITNEDIQKLGELQQAGTFYTYFQDYNLIYPYDVEKVRNIDMVTVKNVNEAIKYVCPYVDEEVKFKDIDYRHSEQNCPPTKNVRKQRAKAHFLWAFSHLTEAVSFYLVLFYKEDSSSSKSNIEARLDALKSIPLTQISSYVSHLKHFIDNVDAIFNTQNNSMLNGMLADLNITNLAFARLAGVPISFTQSITKTINEIEAKKALITGATDEEKETKSLKAILTQKMSSNLSAQITSLATQDPATFNANKTEICSAYSSLSEGLNIPDVCK